MSSRKEYSLRLYNSKGEVKRRLKCRDDRWERALGFEIYYGDTLKYPKKDSELVPAFPSTIETPIGKQRYIHKIIATMEEKRVAVNLLRAKKRKVKALGEKRVDEVSNKVVQRERSFTLHSLGDKKMLSRFKENLHVRQWKFEYDEPFELTLDSMEQFTEYSDIIKKDFKDVIENIWPHVAKAERRFLIKLITPHFDSAGHSFARKTIESLGAAPTPEKMREYKAKGYEVNKIFHGKKNGFDTYSYLVQDKVIVEDKMLELGFSTARTGPNRTKDQLINDYNNLMNEFFNKAGEYLRRKFTAQIDISGMMIECVVKLGGRKDLYE